MLGPSCARQRRHRSSAVMSTVHRPQLYVLQAATDPSPAPAVRWFIIALKFSQQSARRFFTRPQFRPTRNVGEWEQSSSSHSRAVFLHCPDTTTGSRPAAKNWLELFDILHRPATAAVNPLLLSSLASFAFYTGRSFAQFFLVSGLPLCPLCRGVNGISRKFSQYFE